MKPILKAVVLRARQRRRGPFFIKGRRGEGGKNREGVTRKSKEPQMKGRILDGETGKNQTGSGRKKLQLEMRGDKDKIRKKRQRK